MSISLIIVNFDVYDNLYHALKSITAVNAVFKYEIVVVDNQPQQTSIDKIAADFPNVKYIKQPFNLGFGRANNVGAKNSDSQYLCFLNPDTILTEDFISPILEFMEKNENVGVCAPMLVYEDRSYQSSVGFRMGLIYEFMEATMLIEIYRKILKRKYLKLRQNHIPVRVGWVSGACMTVKRSVFEKVGGFTEDYFLNYEDIDICRKIEDAGYLNYYFPFLECIHLDHKSFERNYELLVFSRYESRLIYANLHYNILTRILVRLIHINGLILRLSTSWILFRGSEKKGRFSGYFKSLKLYIGVKP
ncbi:MAG: glycosyltransferase family 2 protein [Ignavibacteria bacterium]